MEPGLPFLISFEEKKNNGVSIKKRGWIGRLTKKIFLKRILVR